MNHFSFPAYLQANGQAEVTNRMLLDIIKKRLVDSKGLWPDELSNIFWAYHTTIRTPIGKTSFQLTFETEAVIPVEIGMTMHRTTNFDLGKNEEGLRNNLDLLEEKMDEVTLRTIAYKQRMTKYYNSQVKVRRFIVGDLVIRKVSLVTQYLTKGKLRLNWEGPYQVIHYNRPRTYHLKTMQGEFLPRP